MFLYICCVCICTDRETQTQTQTTQTHTKTQTHTGCSGTFAAKDQSAVDVHAAASRHHGHPGHRLKCPHLRRVSNLHCLHPQVFFTKDNGFPWPHAGDLFGAGSGKRAVGVCDDGAEVRGGLSSLRITILKRGWTPSTTHTGPASRGLFTGVGNNSVVLIPEAQHIIVEQAVERDSDSEVAKHKPTRKRKTNRQKNAVPIMMAAEKWITSILLNNIQGLKIDLLQCQKRPTTVSK